MASKPDPDKPTDEERLRRRQEEIQEQRKMEEGFVNLGMMFPPLWRRMYENCVDTGFTEEQSLILVQTYILSQCPYGVNGTKRA